MIKDRNGKDLREAEEIDRWKNIQKNYIKKGPNDPENRDGVVTHLPMDILESEVKWTIGSIKTNKACRGDWIPAELFKNPKRWCC